MSNKCSFHFTKGGLRVVAVSSLLAASLAAAVQAAEPVETVFETIPPGEAGQIEATAAIMKQLQDKRRDNDETQNGMLLRAVHPKSHGCVKAKFTVNDGLEEEYRVGLFAQPGKTYDAWIRYSNAAALREDDLKDGQNGSRGMALKILDVDGEFLDLDNGENNQDFLMINTTQFVFPDVRNYLRLNRLLLESRFADNAKPFFGGPIPPPDVADPSKWQEAWADFDPKKDPVTIAKSGKVLGEILSKTVRNPIEVQYFGAAPFLFGPDRAMKFSVAPHTVRDQAKFTGAEIARLSSGYLRKALAETMSHDEEIKLDFKVQLRDRAGDPAEIEDASTNWGKDAEDEIAKYRSVARIDIAAPQELDSQEMIEFCEKLAFNPWHALAAHQPIGGINRVRRPVYFNSAQHRGAASP